MPFALFCASASASELFVSIVSPAGTGYKIDEFNTVTGAMSVFTNNVNAPEEIAFDAKGDLFEADRGSGNVYEFSPSGQRSVFASGLGYPQAVAVDALGDVYVGDDGTDEVYEYPKSGGRITISSSFYPTSLTVDTSGNLYVSDLSTAEIWKITPSGAKSVYGVSQYTPSQTVFDSSGILFDADTGNNTVEPDGVILEFTSNGTRSTFASDLRRPRSLALDTNGDVWVADEGAGNVYEYSAARQQTLFATGLDGPNFLAIDPVPEPESIDLLAVGMICLCAVFGFGRKTRLRGGKQLRL